MINKIIYVSVKKLMGLKNNPRNISEEGIKLLKRSLKKNPKYFEARPCLVNKRTGKYVVYAGNQRLRAARELGLRKVPCIIESLTITEEKERTIRDNIEFGEWNRELLLDGFDMDKIKSYGISNNGSKFILPNDSIINEKELDENLETNCKCPKCGYEWNN